MANGVSDNNASMKSEEQKNFERDKELWDTKLQIHLQLKRHEFSDNKIYGQVKVEPEEARRLIKQFQLVYGDSIIYSFDREHRFISAVGFDTCVPEPSVYITALPIYRELGEKESEHCAVTLKRQYLSLVPTISFKSPLSSKKDSPPLLLVKWARLDDRMAHKYVLRMDKKNICCIYVDKEKKSETMVAHIHNLKSGSKHTIQVIAQHGSDNQETSRSELLHFTVPFAAAVSSKEVINVKSGINRNDFLDDINTSNEEEPEETVASSTNRPPLESRTEETNRYEKRITTLHCKMPGPHDSFLGIDHYIPRNNDRSASSSSTLSKSKPTSHRTVDYRSQEYDDDDDVEVSES